MTPSELSSSILTDSLDVFLQIPLLVGAANAGQMHPVEAAVLLRLVPICLKEESVSYGANTARAMVSPTLKKMPI